MVTYSTDSVPRLDENFSFAPLLARIEHYWQQQIGANHRSSIVLIGQTSWQHALLVAAAQDIKDWPIEPQWLHLNLNRQMLRHKLGQVLDAKQACLVIDLSQGIDAESLALVDGLLPAGALCFWLIPDTLDDVSLAKHALNHPLARQLSFPWQPAQLTPEYDLWAIKQLSDSSVSLVLRQQSQVAKLPNLTQSNTSQLGDPKPRRLQLTPEQNDILVQLKDQLNHDAPALVIGQRGRGKSTLLGQLFNQLVRSEDRERPLKLVISSARPEHHQQAWLTMEPSCRHQVQRWAPDALLTHQVACDLLIIDEAAHLPIAQLKALIKRFPNLIATSTETSYEGSGQGWQHQLRPWLNQQFAQWQEYYLTQPQRWALNDPLESLIAKLTGQNLHFTCEYNHPQRVSRHDLRWECLTPQALSQTQREHVFALLKDSHYQTRPRDWQLLSCAPNFQLALIWRGEHLIGALWAILEGPLPDWGPDRRLQGHLVTQKLRQIYQLPALYSGHYARCSRIAIARAYRGQGLGKELVHYWRTHPSNQSIDSYSVSFGAKPDLWRFWSACDFHTLHLGVQADAASGRCNLIMMTQPKAKSLQQPFHQMQQEFKSNWQPLVREFTMLNEEVTESDAWQVIWQTHADWQAIEIAMIEPQRVARALIDYAHGYRPYESVIAALHYWFTQQPNTLTQDWPELRLWQWKQEGKSWAYCRQAWSALSGQNHIGRKGLEALLQARILQTIG